MFHKLFHTLTPEKKACKQRVTADAVGPRSPSPPGHLPCASDPEALPSGAVSSRTACCLTPRCALAPSASLPTHGRSLHAQAPLLQGTFPKPWMGKGPCPGACLSSHATIRNAMFMWFLQPLLDCKSLKAKATARLYLRSSNAQP